MSRWRTTLARLVGALRGGSRDRALDEEIQAHLDLLTEEHVARGLPPDEARQAARRSFGGIEQMKEVYRDQRGWPALDALAADVRFAYRALASRPAFTSLAVVGLAAGIAVSTAFFTIVNAICFRGLPIDSPDRVLFVSSLDGRARPGGIAPAELLELARHAPSFSGLAAYAAATVVVGGHDQPPDRVAASYISSTTLSQLGVAPMTGRDLAATDDTRDAAPVALVGEAFWASRYGRDPGIIGRSIRVDGTETTVVGVMPESFRFPGHAQLWLPLSRMPDVDRQARTVRNLAVFGRLEAGASRVHARADVDAVARRLAREQPASNQDVQFVVEPINARFTGRVTDTVWLAFITAGLLVLLVACANVATLLLTRAAARAHEIALRLAIGATRRRIVRELLIESVVIAVLAGGLGLLLARGAVALLAWSVPQSAPLPYWIQFVADGRVMAALAVICALSVIVAGLVPAMIGSRRSPIDLIKESGPPGAGRSVRWWTSAFLAAELALALVLVANVVLNVRVGLEGSGDGVTIDPSPLLTARVTLPPSSFGDAGRRRRFYDRVAERLETIDGIDVVSRAPQVPPAGSAPRYVGIEGQSPLPTPVRTLATGARFFAALAIPVRSGRDFAAADGQPGHEAAVVNERFASLYLGRAGAIGRRIRLSATSDAADGGPWLTIVGVAADLGRSGAVAPDPLVFVADGAAPPASAVLLIRTSRAPGDLAAMVRSEVAALEPDVPLSQVAPMSQAMREAGWNGRVSSTIINTISGLALLMAIVGLYGVTSHAVVQRRREIGIRMALGARPVRVMWLVWRGVLWQVGLGLAAGIPLTFGFQRLFTDPSVSVQLTHPTVIVPVAALVVATSLVGSLLPVLRASRITPVAVLRRS